MYARCPSCDFVYQLAAKDLAEAAGTVRCGNCGKTFNALLELFETHPGSGESPIKGGGMPPLLEQRSIVQTELPGVSLAPPEQVAPPMLHFDDQVLDASEKRWPWSAAAALLGLALGWQLQFYYSHPDYASAWPGQATAVPTATVESIQVLARDLHRHPSLDDAIIISLTLGNTGDQVLAWPTLEFRLFDPSQQVLGVRRLDPSEYLDRPERAGEGMPPGLIVPVIAEFVVGTTQPSGFEFRLL